MSLFLLPLHHLMSNRAPRPSPIAGLADAKPLLRGYSHGLTTPVALAAAIFLAVMVRDDPVKLTAMLVYGVTMVMLFGGSAVYHIGHWSDRVAEYLRRLDHSNIYLFIAGTYTPIAAILLQGWWRISVLAVVWVLAVTGLVVVVTGVPKPRWLEALSYVGIGWVAIAALPRLVAVVKGPGLALLVAGGALYSIGAVCYALRRPTLSLKVFGYHELFHLMVIGATASFFTFMVLYVVPSARV